MRSSVQNGVILSLLVLGMASCDRNIAPFVPGELPREPDLSRIFPAPEETPSMAGGASGGSLTPGAAGVGRPGAGVRGNVRLAQSDAGAEGTLFIIARPQGVSGGPPLAVLRVESPEFPLAFEIGPDQVMIPGMRFEGAIDLSARLDGDGDAMTRDEGDPQTGTPLGVVPGSVGVELLLGSAGSASPGLLSAAPPAGGRPSVQGTIRLAESAASRAGTLFIIARARGVKRGPPMAVLRVSTPGFPLDFEIGPEQVMIPGMRFEGPIDLTARLDADGDAMTNEEGDPQTREPLEVVPGSTGVEILLR
jgi:hypothetical protein